MSIASAISTKQTQVAACYTACNNKGATMPAAANQNLSNLATTIGTISAGGGDIEAKDVNFRDYDGTLVASYTATEFASLSALPANPSHTGLTAQGWNWTLANAKTYVAAYGRLEIGQMYITSDGKTRLYISITDSGRMTVPLYWNQTVAYGVEIDWGDGSATYTASGTWDKNTSHTYSAIGDYMITLTVKSGTMDLVARSSNAYSIMGNATSNTNAVYRNMLKRVEIGSGVTALRSRAFYNCYSLASITIPNTLTYMSDGEDFYSCYSLSYITIPSGVTSIGSSEFYDCYSLSSISIPNTVTSIGNRAFYYCYPLASATIPSTVTSIGEYMFSSCRCINSIIIPNDVTSIGNSAFSYCTSLSYITIPNGVTSIGDSAFNYCCSLASITIPNTVTSIGTNAFRYCSCIKSIYILSTTPPTLSGDNAFSNIASDAVIYVPSASVDTYKAAEGWSDYADKIQAIP